MRCAKGLATGKGRRAAGGVDGAISVDSELDDDDDGIKLVTDEDDDEASGGEMGVAGGSAGRVGKEACGEGGGRTNELGRSDGARGLRNVGAGNGGGITSVSYAGTTLTGDANDRREMRVIFLGLALPTLIFAGDFLGDLRGDFTGDMDLQVVDCRTGEDGAGVGGRSANITSTCHDLFSSRNLMRSAFTNKWCQKPDQYNITKLPILPPSQLSLSPT